MKSKENVFKDRTVMWFISLPLVFSLISVILIYEETMYLSFTKEGFKNFMEWFQFSLYTAALAFPLGAFAVSNFRAKQMHKSIETAQNNIELAQSNLEASRVQNTFNNYYKHVEEFNKRLEKLEEIHNIKFTHKSELYHLIFPNNSPKQIELIGDIAFLQSIDQEFKNTTKYVSNYIKENITAVDITRLESCGLALRTFRELALIEYKLKLKHINPFHFSKFNAEDSERRKHALDLHLKNDEQYYNFNIIDDVLKNIYTFSNNHNCYDSIDTYENQSWLKRISRDVMIFISCHYPGELKATKRFEIKKESRRN